MKKLLKYIFIFVLLSLVGHSYVIYKFYHDGILLPDLMMVWNKWFLSKCFYLINGVTVTGFIHQILD